MRLMKRTVGNGRNITVEALNERRISAVKLRLSGLSNAEAARHTGLSQATVIAAVKAYRKGGWAGVPVSPRGRGIRKNLVARDTQNHNIRHFLSDENSGVATTLVP